MRASAFALAILAGAMAGCSTAPLGTSLPKLSRPSGNFGERRPTLVILHHTGDDNVADALRTLQNRNLEVSAHYLIGRDGTIYQLVDERLRAWHAGVSKWGSTLDVNSVSIGIELDNDGVEPYAEPEIVSLIALLTDLRTRYRLPAQAFWGHADIAPRRKVDPSRLFPWRRLAALGLGIWCDPPYAPAPEDFDMTLGLQALGYDVSDPSAALAAYKSHFAPGETGIEAVPVDRDRLSCLVGQAASGANAELRGP